MQVRERESEREKERVKTLEREAQGSAKVSVATATSITERSRDPPPRRTDAGRFADGTIKVVSDQSAEERFMSRSIRFRKKLRSWLKQNIGDSWATLSELYRDAANYAGCNMQTAGRWIYQYTGPGQEWQIIEGEDEYTLAIRQTKLLKP